MSTPFNNRLRKTFEAKNKEKGEEKNKGEIPVNPKDPETKEDTITSVNYSITDNPESGTKKPEIRKYDLSFKGLQKIKEEVEKGEYKGKQDFADIFNTTKDNISFTIKKGMSGNTVCYCGDVTEHDLKCGYFHKFPKIVVGDLDLYNLETLSGIPIACGSGGVLELPKIVVGDLKISNLKTVKDLKLPKIVVGNLYLNHLETAEELNLPDAIDGDLNLCRLRSVAILELPGIVRGDLDLDKLISAENLKLPNTLGGSLNLNLLTSIEDLKLPGTVGGFLNLNMLTSAEDVKLPKTINGDLYLNRLTKFWCITSPWPSRIKGTLFASNKLSQKDKAFLERKYPNKVEYR